ncbi:response regulator [Azoarcus sp. TTM-91]|uniref:response regulator n=1 Tax=Azoarcus sp. TTM-91 TaxID=2691581 RepID=UPI00145C6122|nr:response regulator [Azoarcus sp. TTM-91]NMG36384.1 response regulator [Azoarcus sp. TTM-91]
MNATAAPTPDVLPALRVALVEDSPLLGQILSGMLEEMGVELVGRAEDERGALDLLAERQPALVIVDLELHAGSGIGVLRALHAEPARFGAPRAVVLSNYAHSTVREHCAALGAEAFFDKSMQMDELLDFVARAQEG